MNPLVLDKTFTKENYAENRLALSDYENCTFKNCTFSEAYLSNISFSECNFIECDFTNAKIRNTTFNEAMFNNCKMVGILFSEANPFLLSFNFTDCNLHLASFYGLQLKAIQLKNCNLGLVDFSECNMSQAIFDHCNLEAAVFSNTNLEKANFSSAYNFTIDPEKNNLKKAVFSKNTIDGLLKKYQIVFR